MEKVTVTMTDGSKFVVNHNSSDKSFDDIIQFNDESYVVLTMDGYRLPIGKIQYYKVEKGDS